MTLIHVYSSKTTHKVVLHEQSTNGFQELLIEYPKVESNIPFWSQFKKFKAIKNCINKALKQLNSIEFDLIHYHVMVPMVFLRKHIQQQLNKPYLITEHSTRFVNPEYSYSLIETKYIRDALKNASLLTTVSEDLLAGINNIEQASKTTIIPNVVDTNQFNYKIPENNNDQVKTILHVSDLKDNHKNISGLINVVTRLARSRNDFRLIIVGGGSDRKQLEELASKSGFLNEQIFFKGELEGTALLNEFKNCTFLSLFSNYETFGVVLIEALACGKPVVASAHACIKEFVTEKQGFLVEPKNEDELLKAFNKMLDYDLEEIFPPETLSSYVKDRYSLESVGKQLNDCYTSIIQNNK